MEDSNKRIFKNTGYLYIRQLVVMAISLFTTRIVLEKLGVDDYGIYQVVGGFVAMFAVLNNILTTASRRFIAISLGKEDNQLKIKTFSTAFVIHLLIGFIVVILLETVGLWLLNNQLNIDSERMWAARWVFHISVFNIFLNITQTPYTASVTAHEHFNMYAYMSIFDVLAKLAVLYLLIVIPFDKLIVYALLLSVVGLINILVYRIYCIKKFQECKLSLKVDKPLFKEMLSFSGWDAVGNIGAMLNSHGITVLLNVYFTTAINASRGLASTVSSTIGNFVTGFMTASSPQLAKFYAQNDMVHFTRLVFNISQVTLFLLAVFAVPVFMEIDYVLSLWLTTVPEYTSLFIKITIIACFVQYSSQIVMDGIMAIGRVKQFTLWTMPIYLLHLPLVWLALWLGCTPTVVYWIGVLPSFLGMMMNLHILHRFANFPAVQYYARFLKNVLLVMLSCIIPYFVRQQMEEGFIRFLVVCSLSVFCTIGIMYGFALNKDTRQLVKQRVLGFLSKKLKK